MDTCESGIQALDFVKAHLRDHCQRRDDAGHERVAISQSGQGIESRNAGILDVGQPGSCRHERSVGCRRDGLFAKRFDRDEFVATVRPGMELFGLNRMILLEDSLIRRAQSHHAILVEKLRQHDGAYAMLDTHTVTPERSRPVDQAWKRRAQYRSTVIRHMARLDKFLLNLAEFHRGTSGRLSVVQDNIRRHALTRMQDRYS